MNDKLSDDEVKDMLGRLARHFGEPVMPIGQYCAALRLWHSALTQKVERLQAAKDRGEKTIAASAVWGRDVETTLRDARDFADKVSFVFLQISKSNLLARLLYSGESLRSELCPVHQGFWSGCTWHDKDEDNCACQRMQDGSIDSNVTGWLP